MHFRNVIIRCNKFNSSGKRLKCSEKGYRTRQFSEETFFSSVDADEVHVVENHFESIRISRESDQLTLKTKCLN